MSKIKKCIEHLGSLAPSLAFGVIFLYWEGYLFLVTYLQSYSISINLSDFSFQDVLLAGINPFLVALLWISKRVVIFEGLKVWFLASHTKQLLLDLLVFSSVILFIILVCKLSVWLRNHIIWKRSPYLQPIIKMICYRDIFKTIIMVFSFVFIALFLPRWAAFETLDGLGYQVITHPYPISLVYQAPTLAPQDVCDESERCSGNYIKILEGKDYLYLNPMDKCKIQKVVGQNHDSGPNGEKIFTNLIVEKIKVCDSFAVPRSRILEIINI